MKYGLIILLQIFIIIGCLYVQYVTIVQNTIVEEREENLEKYIINIEEPFTGNIFGNVVVPSKYTYGDKDMLVSFEDGVHQFDMDANVDYGPETVGNVFSGNVALRSSGDLSSRAIQPIIYGNVSSISSRANGSNKLMDFSMKDRKSNKEITTKIPIQFPTPSP